MTRFPFVFLFLLCATPAFSQTYVAAALSGDLSRSFESTVNGTEFPDGDREALGWALRVGTAFGSRWGVELEFHRSGELDTEGGIGLPYLISPIEYSISTAPGGATISGLDRVPTILPRFPPRTQQRTMTWNASAWIKQSLGSRADLIVLGGLGFSHVTQEIDFSILAAAGLPPSAGFSYRSKSTSYGVGPLVGAEVGIRMTDHLELVPGVRVQSLGNALTQGLLLRPSVALRWTF